MTADQRFSITLLAITLAAGAVGWLIRLMFTRFEALTTDRQALLDAAAKERQEQIDRHSARNAQAVNTLAESLASTTAKLTDLYADMNMRLGRIEGFLSRDKNARTRDYDL